MATLTKATATSPWGLSETTTKAGTVTYNFNTAGTFVDRNIGLAITTPLATETLGLNLTTNNYVSTISSDYSFKIKPTASLTVGWLGTAPTASDTTYYVKAGSFSNAATEDVLYTENTANATVIPAEGALYINAGWIDNTKITLGHMIPDPSTGEYNAGVAQMRSNYVAYDKDGKKIIGTMADAAVTVSGSTAATKPSIANITAAVSGRTQISASPSTATSGISTYYIAVNATAPATTVSLTKTINTVGYIDSKDQIAVSANTTETTGDTYYIPIASGSCTVEGGGLSKGTASGGGLSGGGLSVTSKTVTSSTLLELSDNDTYNCNITVTGSSMVERAAVTRAKFSQVVTRADITDTHTAGYIPTKTTTTVIGSTTSTVELAADNTTIPKTSTSPSVTKYVTALTIPASKTFGSSSIAGVTLTAGTIAAPTKLYLTMNKDTIMYIKDAITGKVWTIECDSANNAFSIWQE